MTPEIRALLSDNDVRTPAGFYRIDLSAHRMLANFTLIESRDELLDAIRTADDIIYVDEDANRRPATAEELKKTWLA